MDSNISRYCNSEVNEALPDRFTFICFASFEDRCLTLINSIEKQRIKSAIVIRNIDKPLSLEIESKVNLVSQVLPECIIKDVSLSNSTDVADNLYKIVTELIDSETKEVVIDISTFTHEALLILLGALVPKKDEFSKILLVYTGADSYSVWLSKGCKEVRNVIGYPGVYDPSKRNHLIILSGFEQERATKLVELLEPDIISIGNGTEPTNTQHNESMEIFKRRYEEWLDKLRGIQINKFDFSCQDIVNTVKKLNEIICNAPEDNYILVPLNTKLSTVSVALVALNNKRVQVCYPIPEVYNTDYSISGNKFTVVNVKSLL